MPKLRPGDLKVNDVVLVEAYINRYHHLPKKDKNSSSNKFAKKRFVSDKTWKYYKAQYELINISLLLSAPLTSSDNTDSSDDDQNRKGKGKARRVAKVFTY